MKIYQKYICNLEFIIQKLLIISIQQLDTFYGLLKALLYYIKLILI